MIHQVTLATLFLAVSQINAQPKDCPKGSYEYRGDCVLDLQPEVAPPVKPSDEKPPKDKMPSYEREGIHALTPPSLEEQDEKEDQLKAPK